MDLSVLTTQTVITFMMILFRVSGMLVSAPFFNGKTIPVQVKIGLAFTISLLLFPFHSAKFVVPTDLIQFTLIGAQELIIGLMLGFVADLLFVALHMAGEFVSLQMGMSMASILDPNTGIQVPVMGQIYFYFGLLIFLSLNAHHFLILSVSHSFDVLPLGQFFDLQHGAGRLSERILWLTGDMLQFGLLIAAPVMGVLLVSEVAIAFVSKVMPQMNVFVVAMPLKLIIGLTTLAICIPYLNELLTNRFGLMYGHLRVLFNP